MKIPSLTFPTEHVNNIMTLATFLRKPTWSKTYLQIMINYKSKKLYFTNQLYGRCQYFTVAYHILVRQVPWKYGYLPFRKANIMNILTSAAFCRDQHNRRLPIFFLIKNDYYCPKFIRHVSVIWWCVSHFSAVTVMKLPSLAFPNGMHLNILIFAAFLRIHNWSKNYVKIMICFKNKNCYYQKNIRQVSIICWGLPQFSLQNGMKIPLFAFPKDIHHEYPEICNFFAETHVIKLPTYYDLF